MRDRARPETCCLKLGQAGTRAEVNLEGIPQAPDCTLAPIKYYLEQDRGVCWAIGHRQPHELVTRL